MKAPANIHLKTPLALAAASALAFTAFGLQPAAQAGPTAGSTCFYAHQINSYRADGPRTLYAGAGSTRVYRINLAQDCHGLADNDVRIVIEPAGNGTICNAAGLTLTAVSSGYAERCFVQSIVRLNPAEIAALPAHDRP